MKTLTSLVSLFAAATLTAALFTTPCVAAEPPEASQEIAGLVETPAPVAVAIEEHPGDEAAEAAPGKRVRKGAPSLSDGDRDCLRHKRARKARSAGRSNSGAPSFDLGPAAR